MRRAPRIIAALASVGLAAVLGISTSASASAATTVASYVALGDSYSAESLVPVQVNLICTRSDRNYPSLVAAAIHPGTVTDVTCGGADTTDMTGKQFGFVPPQFNALKPDTSLVTIGIGGNDDSLFVGALLRCGLMDLLRPFGSACKDYYNSGGTDRLAAEVRSIGPNIDGVLKGIKTRSPNATVLLVGYPDQMPDDGSNCWPLVPISSGDAPYLRDIEKLLNSVMAEQAAAEGVTFVDTYTSSIGHDMCKPAGTRWLEGIIPTSPAAPVHPNELGARNQARQVLAALNSLGM
jgi:lysophospholipase L1-like esterase